MQNNLQINLRKRNKWEAGDLGFALIHRYFLPVYLPWLTLLLGLSLILSLCLYDSPKLLLTLLIILTPLLERAPLFVLSRAVFGNTPGYKETLKSWPSQSMPGLFSQNILHFFSPKRIFLLPTWQLENLTGLQGRKRRTILSRHAGGQASSTFLLFAICEALFIIGFLIFIFQFTPESYTFDLMDSIEETSSLPNGLTYLIIVLYLFAIAVLRPLLVACSFAIYLNTRMELEAWDIELTFRKMVTRLKSSKLISIILLSFSCFCFAEETQPSLPKQQIEEIMKTREFKNTRTVKRLKKTENTKKSSSNSNYSGSALVGLAQVCKILIIAALIAGIMLLIVRFIKTKQPMLDVKQVDNPESPIIMGMETTPESLPTAVIKLVKELWESGDHRAALALLYRATLVKLITNFKISISNGATEGDCLIAVSDIKRKEHVNFFTKLSQIWCMLAYAKQQPDELTFKSICQQWTKLYDNSGVNNA